MLGSNGEFPLLSEGEKGEVMETGREAVEKYLPGGKLIAGVGCPSTELTVERCKIAGSLGFVLEVGGGGEEREIWIILLFFFSVDLLTRPFSFFPSQLRRCYGSDPILLCLKNDR